MNIGDVAARTGLPPKTIRYYEEIGLVTPDRDANGYRRFAAPISTSWASRPRPVARFLDRGLPNAAGAVGGPGPRLGRCEGGGRTAPGRDRPQDDRAGRHARAPLPTSCRPARVTTARTARSSRARRGRTGALIPFIFPEIRLSRSARTGRAGLDAPDAPAPLQRRRASVSASKNKASCRVEAQAGAAAGFRGPGRAPPRSSARRRRSSSRASR
jgi:hypothetical protein